MNDRELGMRRRIPRRDFLDGMAVTIGGADRARAGAWAARGRQVTTRRTGSSAKPTPHTRPRIGCATARFGNRRRRPRRPQGATI